MRADAVLGRLAKYGRDARTFPADAADAWVRDGAPAVWSELASRSLYRLIRWSRSYVIEQHLADGREVRAPGVTIDVFTGPWERLAGLTTRRELVWMAAARARGRVCLVAWRAGRPVGYTWCSTRMDPDIETYALPLPSDAAYLWGLYVPSAERNGGIGSALASARLAWARERGFHRAWRIIRRDNVASLRTVDKTSGSRARLLGEVRYFKLLDRGYTTYRPYDAARTGPVA